MIPDPISPEGFGPEPGHGTLIAGLLETVAAEPVPAQRLTHLGAERLAGTIGDSCVISLLSGRWLDPTAIADPLPEAATLLAPLLHRPIPAGHRHELSAYEARFGVAAEFAAPMRARGRILGQVMALRRGSHRPFAASELRVVQAVADLIALGLEDPRVVPATRTRAGTPAAPPPDNLSRREREILALLALGHTNREIAEQVHLSVRTVEWHRARIQAKLGVTSRAALARIARTHGLLGGSAPDRVE